MEVQPDVMSSTRFWKLLLYCALIVHDVTAVKPRAMQFPISSFISLIHEPIGENKRPTFSDKCVTHIIEILQNMIEAVIGLTTSPKVRYMTKTMAGKLLHEVFYNTVMSDAHTKETEYINSNNQ